MGESLINHVFEKTLKYIEQMPKTKRKLFGQFFTSVKTAQYMASMFIAPQKSELSVLDPGSGSGILTAAIIDRLQSDTNVKHVDVSCYETNKDVLPLLKENLEYLKSESKISVDYKIIEQNYITSQSDDFNSTLLANPNPAKYDWIISNPPYKKIAKDAVEAASMSSVCHGAPNLYFLFAAMGLFNLDEKGEMVFIIPRSWTSGAYFQRFREYLLNSGSLKQIHLFISRNKIFDAESVLQETIIIKVDKSDRKDYIKITHSDSGDDFNDTRSITVPYSAVVVGPEKYVYLATNLEEIKLLERLRKWNNTLPSIGLKMRTGLTVDFRSEDYLKNKPEAGTVPIFYAQHIKNGRVIFPIQREHEYITTEKNGLIQQNKNYLLIKRFTSKEEKRRFQCGIYLSADLPEYKQISTQNKINFIEGIDFDMTDEQVYGLYVIFNSTVYDQYYRILNGSTQVNSTEINAMPVPSLTEIENLGLSLIKKNDLSVTACDELLEELIYG